MQRPPALARAHRETNPCRALRQSTAPVIRPMQCVAASWCSLPIVSHCRQAGIQPRCRMHKPQEKNFALQGGLKSGVSDDGNRLDRTVLAYAALAQQIEGDHPDLGRENFPKSVPRGDAETRARQKKPAQEFVYL